MQHFKNDSALSKKLDVLLEKVKNEPLITSSEQTALQEVRHIYHMQKEAKEDLSPIMQLKLLKKVPHLVSSVTFIAVDMLIMCL